MEVPGAAHSEAISGAQNYVEGMSLNDFRGDSKTVDAVLTKFIVIGEAAALVPVAVQERHAEVTWRKLKGLRNVGTEKIPVRIRKTRHALIK